MALIDTLKKMMMTQIRRRRDMRIWRLKRENWMPSLVVS